MRDLLRDRRFLILFAGQVASMIGDSIMIIVLAIWTKEVTGSSGLAGAVILATTAPALLSPLTGWAVDRVRRRPFLTWLNLASAVVLLPLLLVHGSGGLWLVYAISAGYGLSGTLNSAALSGLLQELVDDEHRPEANSLLRTVQEGLRLLGPLLGAGLFALGGLTTVIVIDAVSFLVAAASMVAIRVPEQQPQRSELHWAAEATAGFRYLFSQAQLRNSAFAMGGAFVVFGTVNSAIFAYVDAGLHRPATFVGVLLTVMGLGSVVGGVSAPKLIRTLGEPACVALGLGALALALALLVPPALWLGLSVAPVGGFGVALIAISFATLLQRRTPKPLMGRVSTATDLLVIAPQTVSIAAGALLVSVVDFRWLFGASAVALAFAAAALAAARSTREAAPRGTAAVPAQAAAEPEPAAERG